MNGICEEDIGSKACPVDEVGVEPHHLLICGQPEVLAEERNLKPSAFSHRPNNLIFGRSELVK